MDGMSSLQALHDDVVNCNRCRRLRSYCCDVAATKRRAFLEWDYWGKPVPGFGDPHARLWIIGLAPAAHGANRTGRIFTGDRSGDFLFAALHRAGFASQPTSTGRGDGLELIDAWMLAAVRCAPPANKPTPAERDTCLPWALSELALLPEIRVVVCLGAFAWDAAFRLRGVVPKPRPKFGHGALVEGPPWSVLGCFHPSQHNTFTGRLTAAMLDAILVRARALS